MTGRKTASPKAREKKDALKPLVGVVLVRPETPGNVGAVARVMANFGFQELVLVDPRCDHRSSEAIARAKHGKAVLEAARVVPTLKKAGCDWLVATSGKLGSDYNLPRTPVTPRQLVEVLQGMRRRKIGLVFGPESSGLLNAEVEGCDVFVTIPADPKYPILNLSQAAGILLYELSVRESVGVEGFVPLTAKDKEILYGYVEKALDALTFETPQKRETQRRVWRRMIGKAMLTRREAFALMGFFRRVLGRQAKKGKGS
jgi:tRNA/rRNA methyltransferase